MTGPIQPIDSIGEIARPTGAFFWSTRAQCGTLPIDFVAVADRSARPFTGSQRAPRTAGNGNSYACEPGVEEHLQSVRQGGTGTNSEDDHQPSRLPDKYESGNHNVPGLFGLEAALGWLEKPDGRGDLPARAPELTEPPDRDAVATSSDYGFTDRTGDERVGVVSVTIDGIEPHELATVLDSSFGIETRAACTARRARIRCLGTFAAAARLRMSAGAIYDRG